MRTQLLPPALALAVALLCGCEPVPHYNRVQAASFTGQPSKVPSAQRGKIKPYGSVKLFEAKTDVPQAYEVIGMLSVEGEAGDEARLVNAMLYRAADMGADGIIFSPSTADTSTFVRSHHRTHLNGAYRAEVIRYK